MNSKFRLLSLLVVVAAAAFVGLRWQSPDLGTLKARAAALEARQAAAYAEAARIEHSMTGHARDAALLKVPYLSPGETADLSELQDEIDLREMGHSRYDGKARKR